ncbi:MAG: hypothetical protein JNIBNLAF_01511 [Nitrosomonas europaea]|nr:hypothetical protein [Nitrosomonas europaea]
MIDVVMYREWHHRVGTIDTGAAGIHQVLDIVMTATFENMSKTNDVAVNIGKRVFNRIAHPGLGCQIHHPLRLVSFKTGFDTFTIRQIQAQMSVTGVISKSGKAIFLQFGIIIIIVVIDTDDGVATFKQPQRQCRSNKAG